MDFAVTASAAKKARSLLEAEGYVADQFFNRLHGATRLFYAAPDGRWSVDVIVDLRPESPTYDVEEELQARLENGVLWLTINRADKGNATEIPIPGDAAAGFREGGPLSPDGGFLAAPPKPAIVA